MQDFSVVYVNESVADLHEPIQYQLFWERLVLLLVSLDMESKITLFAVLHDDDKLPIFQKAVLKLHDVAVV